MSLKLDRVGLEIPMYPGCNHFELILSCLIPIPLNLRAEYVRLNEAQIQALISQSIQPDQKNADFGKRPQLQNADVRGSVEAVLESRDAENFAAKASNKPSNKRKKFYEESLVAATSLPITPTQIFSLEQEKLDTFQTGTPIGHEREFDTKAYSTTPVSIPTAEKTRWDILFEEKIRPLLPPFWQGQLPTERGPVFVHIQKEVSIIARFTKRYKITCEDEISFYDEMLHFHLLFDKRAEYKTRNDLELKIYKRIMALYYIVAGRVPVSSDEEYAAEKLPKFGKIANNTFRFLSQFIKQWEKLPVSNLLSVREVNLKLETMLVEIEKEIDNALEAIDTVNQIPQQHKDENIEAHGRINT